MMSSGSHRVGDLVYHGHVTPAQREEAAKRAAARRASSRSRSASPAVPVTSAVPDYWGPYPNWAFTPRGLRKFIDPLPDLAAATPDTTTFAGSDYYEFAVVQFAEKLHKDLPNPTTLRGYVQLETPVNAATSAHVPLQYPDGSPILDTNGAQVYAYAAPTYLGPMIVAQHGRPVRLRLTNYLPTGTDGKLFLPVDTTMMGAGTGPDGEAAGNYPENRTVLHLHGGDTVWISDGTPNQWITPAGESSVYKKGVSVVNVPDMVFDPVTHAPLGLEGTATGTSDPGPGSQTYYYTNNESARLLWIHDHALGITRLNVYAGMAGAYLLQDTAEKGLVDKGVAAGGLPADQIPMVIQDKTFLPGASDLAAQDPTWSYLPGLPQTKGSLWFPHVYMANQDPYDDTGAADKGRWDYGPWFWPVFGTAAGLKHDVIPNIYAANGEPAFSPGTPNPTIVPEAFMDTMLVNGKAYPYKKVSPKPYRLRILNACNDRYLNLQLYTSADGGGGKGAKARASPRRPASGSRRGTATVGAPWSRRMSSTARSSRSR
jgi:FtsP/CotA-like multicopper oxidase with cupredoxin domain